MNKDDLKHRDLIDFWVVNTHELAAKGPKAIFKFKGIVWRKRGELRIFTLGEAHSGFSLSAHHSGWHSSHTEAIQEAVQFLDEAAKGISVLKEKVLGDLNGIERAVVRAPKSKPKKKSNREKAVEVAEEHGWDDEDFPF